MSEAAWSNMISAMPIDSQFACDLAQAVTNDGEVDGAARWFLSLASQFLRDNGQPDGPIPAFDFSIHDWEALTPAWPVMSKSAELHGCGDGIVPMLARFVCERLPAVWGWAQFHRHPPVTSALVLAERADDLVGMFSIGLKPNGSKDPFALRRAAKHLLQQIVFPITVGQKVAA